MNSHESKLKKYAESSHLTVINKDAYAHINSPNDVASNMIMSKKLN